jgi:hypothetical protein
LGKEIVQDITYSKGVGGSVTLMEEKQSLKKRFGNKKQSTKENGSFENVKEFLE